MEEVKFRVVWKKNSYNVTFPLDKKVLKLKEHIQTLTGTYTTGLQVCAVKWRDGQGTGGGVREAWD